MDSGDLGLAVDLGREALWVAVKLSFPILLSALIVGALISVLQAATQLQDQTLNQVPKMFTVAAVVFVALPWILAALAEYTQDLVGGMGMWFR
ncbi:MAG: flagellar biosynthetic protein FliQ [Planctomycetota bacterium]|nr:MAG: flagellar biosynthetic protein FliQ [Planctomycetota bacterium]